MSYLVLIRHAESTGNLQGIFQGQKDYPLSKTGQKQAEELADKLSRHAKLIVEPPELIVSSDLTRARATAQALQKQWPVELELDPDLRERSGGSYEGLAKDIAIDAMTADLTKSRDVLKEHGYELDQRVRERAHLALTHWLHASDGRPTLIVSHGHWLNVVFQALPIRNRDNLESKVANASAWLLDWQAIELFGSSQDINPGQEIELIRLN